MPSVHRHPPIPFRPPAGDRERLLAHAEQSGKAVNAILAEALRRYLADEAAQPVTPSPAAC